jgi:hypothetical protein
MSAACWVKVNICAVTIHSDNNKQAVNETIIFSAKIDSHARQMLTTTRRNDDDDEHDKQRNDVCVMQCLIGDIAAVVSSHSRSPHPFIVRGGLELSPPWISTSSDTSTSTTSEHPSPTSHLRERCSDARVAVSVSDVDVFRGSVYDNERIDVRFDEFLDRFDAALLKKANDDASDEPANKKRHSVPSYYLAQCSIVSSSSSPLAALADDVMRGAAPLIDAFGGSPLECNLWMTLQSATTSPHFDENHGLLCVVHGVKNVRLASPARTSAYRAHSAVSAAANHSQLESDDSCFELSVDVAAGDCLFIPENWWHSVRSSPCCVALNFWFAGRATQLMQSDMNCARSVCRRVLRELADARVADALRALDSAPSSVEEAITFERYALTADTHARARLLRRLDQATLADFVAAAAAIDDDAQFAQLFERMMPLCAKVMVDLIDEHAIALDIELLRRFFGRLGAGDEREGEKRLLARAAAFSDEMFLDYVLSEEFGIVATTRQSRNNISN